MEIFCEIEGKMVLNLFKQFKNVIMFDLTSSNTTLVCFSKIFFATQISKNPLLSICVDNLDSFAPTWFAVY